MVADGFPLFYDATLAVGKTTAWIPHGSARARRNRAVHGHVGAAWRGGTVRRQNSTTVTGACNPSEPTRPRCCPVCLSASRFEGGAWLLHSWRRIETHSKTHLQQDQDLAEKPRTQRRNCRLWPLLNRWTSQQLESNPQRLVTVPCCSDQLACKVERTPQCWIPPLGVAWRRSEHCRTLMCQVCSVTSSTSGTF